MERKVVEYMSYWVGKGGREGSSWKVGGKVVDAPTRMTAVTTPETAGAETSQVTFPWLEKDVRILSRA